jgi:tetratricopeptide (TPR) repeat protein
LHQQRGSPVEACDKLWEAAELLGRTHPRTPLQELGFTLSALVVHLAHRLFGHWRRPKDAAERTRLLELSSIYRSLGEVYAIVDQRRMIAPLLEATNAGEQAGGDSRELCRAYPTICYLYMYLAMFRSSWRFGSAALAMAERLGLSLEVGVATAFLAMSRLNAGIYAGVLDQLSRARALLVKHGDMFVLCVCETTINGLRLWQGDTRAALQGAAEITQLVERTGSQAYGKSVIASLGYIHGLLGDAAAAKARFDQAAAMIDPSDEVNAVVTLTFRGHVELMGEDVAAALGSLAAARAIVEKSGSKVYVAGLMYALQALAMIELGRREKRSVGKEARVAVRRALGFTRRRAQFRVFALIAEAALVAAEGNLRKAEKRFAAATAFADAQGAHAAVPDVHFALARARAAAGDRAAADRAFALAAEGYERFRMRLALAWLERARAS